MRLSAGPGNFHRQLFRNKVVAAGKVDAVDSKVAAQVAVARRTRRQPAKMAGSNFSM
jgi:hypothetical protein